MKNSFFDRIVICGTPVSHWAKLRLNRNRKKALVLVILGTTLFLLSGCASEAQRDLAPVMVSAIVSQSKEGVPDDEIIREISDSGTVYRMSASELANLRDKGVSNAVINYMQQTYLEAIRRDQSVADLGLWTYGPDGYYYGGYPFGWTYTYVPYVPEQELLHEHAENSAPKTSAKHTHG